jgi:dihydroxyacetone kinase-like predicted kinase
MRGLAGFTSVGPSQTFSLQSVHAEASRYRYCTSYVVDGHGLDAEAIKRDLASLGDSLLVVGTETALRVHVHTDDPDRAIALGGTRGTVEVVEIADMHEQIAAREQRLTHPVIAVVQGDGLRNLFEVLGFAVVDVPPVLADGVIVLPDIASSFPAQLSAVVAYDAERSVEENVEAMRMAAAPVASGEAAVAEAWPVLERLLAEPRSLLTVLTGAGCPPLDALLARLAASYPELEVQVYDGGQASPELLLGAE